MMEFLTALKMQFRNFIARAVVQLVDDGTRLQKLQVGALDGEDIPDAERFQQYGFSSVPHPGAEAVAMFLGGDRGTPLVIAVDDRRFRPTGKPKGEVAIYTDEGDEIRLERGHVIRVKSSGKVIVDAPIVELGQEGLGPLDGVVHGSGIDPWTGQTYTALGNASAVVKARKL